GPFTLQSILEIYSLPVSVQPTKPLTLLDSGSCLIPTQNLQQLTITNTYQEEFLLGYCLSNKGTPMVRTPLVMPMYMKEVHLALAEGLEEQSQEQWETICNTLSQLVTKLGHMDHFIFQDITLLDKRALSEHGNEYTEMEPIYMKLQQDSRDLTLYEDLRTLAPTPSTTEQKPPPIPPKPSVQLRPMEEKTIPLKRLSSSVALPASYSSLGEVPPDLHGLSVTEVCDCLLMLNLHQYNEAFKREQIDGDFLYMLDTGMMRDSLGMSRMHIIKLLHFRDGWRPKEETFLL
ncbi:GARE1 protein, partial [Amia calva]|nr:GARE1 protein [Amia calva]